MMRAWLIHTAIALSFAWWSPCGNEAHAVPDLDILKSLPQSADDSQVKLINASNASDFKSILPPEMLPLFKEGQLEIEAARSLKTVPHYGPSWQRTSELDAASLTSSGELTSGTKFGNGFLFGDAAALSSETNMRTLAYKVLWNTYSVWAASPLHYSEFEFSWFKDGKAYRTLRGEFSRLIPNLLPDLKQTSQHFRELIRFTSPQVLRDLSWLTFRFLGKDEDAVWVYSPAIQKVRHISATNRSDPLLRSAVTPEEFLVWSGKVESTQAVVEGTAVSLMPFVRSELPANPSPQGCYTVDRLAAVAGNTTARWNTESSHFAHGAGWVPTTTIFLPRPVWKLTATSLDPFSMYGTQVLYVDQDLGLPMYKFVYDRMGQLWKTVIGTFGVATREKEELPFPAYTIVVDHLKSEVYVLDFLKWTACASAIPEFTVADFDPKRFADLAKDMLQPTATAASAMLPEEMPDEF